MLIIVFIKCIQTVSVIGNHTQESIGLIQRQLFVFDDVRKKAYGALQVFQLNSFDLLINGVTLNQVLLQDFVRPDTELGAALRLYTIADRSYHFNIIIFHLITFTVQSSCRKFCDNRNSF